MSMRKSWRTCGAMVAAAMIANAALPCALAADAIPPAKVQEARAAFKDGLELEKKGEYESALAKFRATAAIKTTPQVEFHIALCEAKLKRYIEALADLATAETDAKAGKVKEVAEAAPKLAAEIKPLVPKLTLKVADGQKATAVRVDGHAIDMATLGTPMPFDPGKHVVSATSADLDDKSIDVELADSDDKSVVITFGSAPVATTTTTGGGDVPSELPPPPVMPPSSTDAQPAPSSSSSQRIAGFVVGGVGIVSLGLATTFYLMRNSKVNSLDSECVNMKCPSSAQSDLDAAKTDVTISRIALGVGVVSIGVGAYLILTAKSSSAPPPTTTGVTFVPAAPGALVGAGLQGAF
jgi:hypothetical protein